MGGENNEEVSTLHYHAKPCFRSSQVRVQKVKESYTSTKPPVSNGSAPTPPPSHLWLPLTHTHSVLKESLVLYSTSSGVHVEVYFCCISTQWWGLKSNAPLPIVTNFSKPF